MFFTPLLFDATRIMGCEAINPIGVKSLNWDLTLLDINRLMAIALLTPANKVSPSGTAFATDRRYNEPPNFHTASASGLNKRLGQYKRAAKATIRRSSPRTVSYSAWHAEPASDRGSQATPIPFKAYSSNAPGGSHAMTRRN
jgi:hypothetical protein